MLRTMRENKGKRRSTGMTQRRTQRRRMRQTNKTFSCYFLSLWFRDSWCDREDYDNKYFDPDAALSEWKKKETDWFIHLPDLLPNLLHLQLSGCYLCPCCLYLLLFLFALGGSLLFFWFSQTSGLTFVIISWETITITRQDSGYTWQCKTGNFCCSSKLSSHYSFLLSFQRSSGKQNISVVVYFESNMKGLQQQETTTLVMTK